LYKWLRLGIISKRRVNAAQEFDVLTIKDTIVDVIAKVDKETL
jgi:hypothetical protein